MYLEQLYTGCLAEAAYYIESEGEAAIIDPIRETEPYIKLAKSRNAKIKYIFETHFHADFVSGHIDLAAKTGAGIIYGPGAKTAYEAYNAKDGEEFNLGKLKFKVLHTPGHTPESSCYLLFNETGKEHALFTGDTLFINDVGRPDLLDGVMTKEELAGMLYESLNNKIKVLPENVLVYPAHGPGSACGKNIGTERHSTIGEQRKTNYALQPMSKDEFIKKVTDGILPPPSYFFEDARINKLGYIPLDEVFEGSLKSLSLDNFRNSITENTVILDTRKPNTFEKGFIPNSINIGLDGEYAVWVGTLIDIKKPILLVTGKGKERESVLRLARVGYENVLGYLGGGFDTWKKAGLNFETVKSIQPWKMRTGSEWEILDVRRPGEYKISHIDCAKHFPLGDIMKLAREKDPQKTYMIYCEGGYRSMIASSILKKMGFANIINIYGGFSRIRLLNFNLGVTKEISA
jgi:glyoxylase-like metal-dependent hydrolase (beta-lactamase superfamily II)/rhodanese-related sulfurtransferase